MTPPPPRFAIGYPVHPEQAEDFVAMVDDYRDHIAEVYYSWPGEASGRLSGPPDVFAQDRLVHDLDRFRSMGLATDLLFNAACYGDEALSSALVERISTIIKAVAPIDVITTTSPVIAQIVRDRHPGIALRASVNLRLRSVEAFEPIADLFDAWYVARDVQRNLATLKTLATWSRAHGKQLCLLANSGCLRDCPTQSFHDNLVAHSLTMSDPGCGLEVAPFACQRHLAAPEHRSAILQATWIRPEDLALYVPHVDLIKLATRQHERPRAVLEAYTSASWPGNLLDLLEPTYSTLIAPLILNSRAFPQDWPTQTADCDGICHRCDYCRQVASRVFT